MKKLDVVVTDRYGGRYPNPKTVCKGQCGDFGVYPQRQKNGKLKWIKCPDCKGTGRRRAK